MTVRFALTVLIATLSLAGCGGPKTLGVVVDVTGETLPGVAVEVTGTGFQALSDPLGEFRIHIPQDARTVAYHKTGYTPALLQLPPAGAPYERLTTVSMWPLPEGKGVYFYEKHRYDRIRSIEPEPLRLAGTETPVYGTLRWTDVKTTNHDPIILCHKLPPSGATMCTMVLKEVEPPQGLSRGTGLDAWLPGEDVPMSMGPIDEPERLLVRIAPSVQLATGTYAIHWGALTGDATLNEPQVFLFSVVDELPPQESIESESTPTKPAPKTDEVIVEEEDVDSNALQG